MLFRSVSYVITIDYSGKVKSIFSIEKEEQRGKRKVVVPDKRMVPIHSGRSGKNPKPYFLCDSAKYLLGVWIPSGEQAVDKKNKADAWKYFQASALFFLSTACSPDGIHTPNRYFALSHKKYGFGFLPERPLCIGTILLSGTTTFLLPRCSSFSIEKILFTLPL